MFKKVNYKKTVRKQIIINDESTFSDNEIDLSDLNIINNFIDNLFL